MREGFHWQDGWYFRRTEDGSVEVTKTSIDHVDSPVLLQFTIPAYHWASIVSSVSDEGETSQRWNEACAFHGINNDEN
jgi:hypothetical protein